MVKITLYGKAGTGTTSIGELFAKRNKFIFKSTGNMFRELVKSKGYNLYEFSKLCQKEPKYDLELDQYVIDFAKNNDNFIIDSRLAWYFIKDSIKIKLKCNFDIRINRISKRDNKPIEYITKKTKLREESEKERYFKFYNIKDIDNDSNFDLIIDTSYKSVEESVKLIEDYINIKKD